MKRKTKAIVIMIVLLMSANTITAFAKSQFEYSKNPLNQVVQPPKIEGYFYRDITNGAIYWLVGGRLSHVEDILTYNYIFSNPNYYLYQVDDFYTFARQPLVPNHSNATIIGRSLPAGTKLVKHGLAIYLFHPNSGLAFYIPNMSTFHQYHLNINATEQIDTRPDRVYPFDTLNY